MCNITRHIILKIMCIAAMAGAFLGAPSYLLYAADGPNEIESMASADEMLLFDLINAARKDPLGVAESMGMNRDEILSDFPELENILTQGLPELNFDERLYACAGDHTRDMFENSYYAYDSIDGRNFTDRMNDAGYVASFSGETLGLLYFNNFINSEKAVYQIFDNMYRDELNPDWTGPRNILSPDVKDIGICVGSGIFNFNGISGNVYLSTCDFGTEVNSYELELMALINQARSKPKLVAGYYGLNVAKIIKDFPDFKNVFTNGLSPVSMNALLYNASRNHALDMLVNGYYSSKSKDGRMPEDRIRDTGYEAIWSAESRVLISTCYAELTPQEAVDLIFKRMLLRSFSTQPNPDQNMFSEKALEVGAGIVSGESVELNVVCGGNVNLAVVDYAAPGSSTAPYLMGIVYKDANANNLFDLGEGLPGVAVEIKEVGSTSMRTIATNPIGGYCVSVQTGRYRVTVDTDTNEPVRKWVNVDNANIWFPFNVTQTVN